jgi:hypothetical protein
MHKSISRSTRLAQISILIVTAWNLQAALAFMLQPANYAPGFMLTGIPGAAAVRGVGILLLMWNVPYLVALWDPPKYFLALKLAVVMQLVGLLGESYILSTLTVGYATLSASITRFIAFDGVGLVFLLVAFLSIWKGSRS